VSAVLLDETEGFGGIGGVVLPAVAVIGEPVAERLRAGGGGRGAEGRTS